jgi:hypothetical protein
MMKKLILLLSLSFIWLLSYQISESQEGTVYYFTLFPGQVQPGDTVAQVNLITDVDTEIKIEKGIYKLRENIKIKKNEYLSFSLTASEVQATTKYDKSLTEHIIVNAAIKVTVLGAEATNIFVKTKYGGNSDGMIILDKSNLGNSYQVTNPPQSTFENNIETNFAAIVGIYDNTRITFKMGGCKTCYVVKEDGENLKYNETIRRTLNEGDVWIVPAYGANGVITGATVNSNRPVAVFSGSNEAYSGVSYNNKNYTITQEIPNILWGKSYMLPKTAINNIIYPLVTAFTFAPFNNVYTNGNKAVYIQTPGGINGVGFQEFIAEKDNEYDHVKTSEISGDANINILISDMRITDSRPVLMQILPTERYDKKAVFKIDNPDDDFINIIYKATKEGRLPDDLMIGEFKNNSFVWKSIREYASDGLRFKKTLADSTYYQTTNVKFTNAGTYFVMANDPFAVYQFGIGPNNYYGFPVNGNFDNINSQDSLAPKVEFTNCCLCSGISGTVIDQPSDDPEIRSNLNKIYLSSEDSFNTILSVSNFMSGLDAAATWKLSIIDQKKNSKAHIVFMDKAGNRKDTIIACNAIFPELSPLKNDLGTFNINKGLVTKNISFDVSSLAKSSTPKGIEMYVILDSDSTEEKAGDIYTNQNFQLGDLRDKNIYPLITNNQNLKFDIKFESDVVGVYRDSIGIAILTRNPLKIYALKYFCELNARIGDNYITANDVDFGTVDVDYSESRTVKISNPRKSYVETALDLTIDSLIFSNDDIGYVGSGKIFEIDLPEPVSKENPLIIKPDDFLQFNIKFVPIENKDYKCEITYSADTELPDNITKISGIVFKKDVSVAESLSSEIDIINESGILKFKSETDYTIDEIEIYDIMGKLVLSKKVNQNLDGYTIETSNFTHNVYILKMLINGNWISKKVII